MKSLDEQIHHFALCLIDQEAKVCPRKNKRSANEHEKFLLSVGWLCRKLLLSHSASNRASTRISRDKNRYKAGRYVPEGVTYTIAIEGALDLMDLLGYVQKTADGWFSPDSSKGSQSRYMPTQDFLKQFEVVSSTLPKQLVGHEDTDPIIVQTKETRTVSNKDGTTTSFTHKKRKPYDDTSQTNQWRDNLNIINDCLNRHWADLYLTDANWSKLNEQLIGNKDHDYSPIQLHRQTLRRIFNSTSFDEGGRFYSAWWQNIPSAYRAYVTIDGKFTDEFDYGRLHPTILYAEKGLFIDDDAYDIGIGSEHRDVIKQAFNAMVQMIKPSNTPPREIDIKSTGKTWKEIRDRILEKHEPIADCFFCGMGNKLQFKDSQLAEQVMLRFAKQDIPVLPVHDSFIIIRGLYSELVDVMNEEFVKMFKMSVDIGDSAKVVPVSFNPEEVDVGWILSERDKYGSWSDRNPL